MPYKEISLSDDAARVRESGFAAATDARRAEVEVFHTVLAVELRGEQPNHVHRRAARSASTQPSQGNSQASVAAAATGRDFTTVTGISASCTTVVATDPNTMRSIRPRPREPMTTSSNPCRWA